MSNDIIIDIDELRKDVIDYLGTAKSYNPTATYELGEAYNATDAEIVNIAINKGINIYDYEIKDKHRGR